jgi:hypothetical protein
LLRQQFDFTPDWARFVGKNGTWPDADLLSLGRLNITDKEGGGRPTRFTPGEQKTVMTLWSIFRSPLIFGGDLPSNDAATTALITNEEVLDVDQPSRGGHQSLDRGNIRAWVANTATPAEHYLAVFNLGESAEKVDLRWNDVGLRRGSARSAIDGQARNWDGQTVFASICQRMRAFYIACGSNNDLQSSASATSIPPPGTDRPACGDIRRCKSWHRE